MTPATSATAATVHRVRRRRADFADSDPVGEPARDVPANSPALADDRLNVTDFNCKMTHCRLANSTTTAGLNGPPYNTVRRTESRSVRMAESQAGFPVQFGEALPGL